MRIDPRTIPVAPSALQTQRSTTEKPRFALGAEERSAKGTSAARSSAPLATLDAILALQAEDENPSERRRKFATRGRDLLDALDELKVALIGGRVSPTDLDRIASRLAALGPSGDPNLDEVLAHIDLRAKVELAKLGRIT